MGVCLEIRNLHLYFFVGNWNGLLHISTTSKHRVLQNLEPKRPCVVVHERSEGATTGPEGF